LDFEEAVNVVFLTGATGFLGGEVLRRLIVRRREPVWALVRAADRAEAAKRGRRLLERLFKRDPAALEAALARVEWVPGDLERPGLGLARDARAAIEDGCREIFHSAASTNWELTSEESSPVNLDGTRAVCALAEAIARRGRLARLLHVSTYGVAGSRSGTIAPEDLPPAGARFRNGYEESKAAAERWLRERTGELPITIVRPSAVVGDSATGATSNFNVIYFPLMLLDRGALRAMPAAEGVAVDMVPVDYAADALLLLARSPDAIGRTFHLTAGDDALSIRSFVVEARRALDESRARAGQASIGEVRIVSPDQWPRAAAAERERLSGRARRDFDAFARYLPYTMVAQRFDNRSTGALLDGVAPYPRIADYFDRIVDYAHACDFGRRVEIDRTVLRGS
jgi:thioester reductase-like protein